jgi:hypothetical protein
VSDVNDCEDAAVGSGILSQNTKLFTDTDQVCATSDAATSQIRCHKFVHAV